MTRSSVLLECCAFNASAEWHALYSYISTFALRPSNYDQTSTTTGRSRTSSVIPKQTHNTQVPQVETEEATQTHIRARKFPLSNRVRSCVRVWFASVHRALATLHKHNYYWCWSTVCIAVPFLLLSLRVALLTRNFIVHAFRAVLSNITCRTFHKFILCVCGRMAHQEKCHSMALCRRTVPASEMWIAERLAEPNGITSQHLSRAEGIEQNAWTSLATKTAAIRRAQKFNVGIACDEIVWIFKELRTLNRSQIVFHRTQLHDTVELLNSNSETEFVKRGTIKWNDCVRPRSRKLGERK